MFKNYDRLRPLLMYLPALGYLVQME